MIPTFNFFNSAFYLDRNPDVAAAVKAGIISAFDHFNLYGKFEARSTSPIFDQTFYLTQNPDVAVALSGSEMGAYDHFVTYGVNELRPIHPAINVANYLTANPDVAAAVAAGQAHALYHLLTYGLGEPRDLGNGVHVNSFANDPTFKHALASGDLITALGRIADVSPFFPSFKTPAGWTPPANLAIPIDFVPVAGEQLIIPAGVIVPAGMALPDFITLIKPVTPTEPTEPTKPINPPVKPTEPDAPVEPPKPVKPITPKPDNSEKTVALTTGIDTLKATHFIANPVSSDTGVVSQTLNTGDHLTAVGTESSLSVLWTGESFATLAPTLKNIKTLNISNLGEGVLFLTANQITGLENLHINNSTEALVMRTLPYALQQITLNNTTAETSIAFDAAALSGSADELNVTLNNSLAGSSLILDSTNYANSYEKINIFSTGSANTIKNISSNSSATKTIEISGDQDLTLNRSGVSPFSMNTTTIDASALTGKLTLGGVSANHGSSAFSSHATTKGSVQITGGTGDDEFYLAHLGEPYAINGGGGTNTLHITAYSYAFNNTGDPMNVTTAAAISNIQSLRVVQGSGNGLAADFSANLLGTTGINKLQLATNANTAATIRLNDLKHTDGFTIHAVGNQTANPQHFNGVNYKALGTDGYNDIVTINVENGGQSFGAHEVQLGTQTLDKIEYVVLNLNDMAAQSTFYTTIDANALEHFYFASNAGNHEITFAADKSAIINTSLAEGTLSLDSTAGVNSAQTFFGGRADTTFHISRSDAIYSGTESGSKTIAFNHANAKLSRVDNYIEINQEMVKVTDFSGLLETGGDLIGLGTYVSSITQAYTSTFASAGDLAAVDTAMSSENGVVYINGGENHDVYLFADTDSSGSFSAGDVAVQLIGVGKGAASSMLDIDSDAFII